MFICRNCKQPSNPGEIPGKTVIDSREKIYPFRRDANSFMKDGKKTVSDDPGGRGWEIVSEALVHKICPAPKKRRHRNGR